MNQQKILIQVLGKLKLTGYFIILNCKIFVDLLTSTLQMGMMACLHLIQLIQFLVNSQTICSSDLSAHDGQVIIKN